MKILITGVAGFIGSSLLDRLLKMDYLIVGVDNLDSFYSPLIKFRNIENSILNKNFIFINNDICQPFFWDNPHLNGVDCIIHLAAKAGIFACELEPDSCNLANIIGTKSVLDFAMKREIKKMIFASSSSVYGMNAKLPFSVSEKHLCPTSVYGKSKLTCEELFNLYSTNFNIDVICLRLFTVYGSRQRPDLAIHKFVRNIDNGNPITVYGDGYSSRDYTYIDDVLDGIVASLTSKMKGFNLFNIGSSKEINVIQLIKILEEFLEKKSIIRYSEKNLFEIEMTLADITQTTESLNYVPKFDIKTGLEKFIFWYRNNTISLT